MMRLAVMSDTHGQHKRLRNMGPFLSALKADALIHLGDYSSDALVLKEMFPKTPLYCVAGAGQGGAPFMITHTFEGTTIYMTHGHLEGVKGGLDKLEARALAKGCALALFGHTHIALSERRCPLWLVNPGSPFLPGLGSHAGIALITIDDKGIKPTLLKVDPNFI